DPQEALDEAFALAAYSGRLDAMDLLLAHGARVDGRVHGLPGLHLAIIRVRLDAVYRLLDRGADLRVRDPFHERAPVAWAGGEAERGGQERAEICALLIERTA